MAELLNMMKEHVESFHDRKPFFPGQSCFPLSPCKKQRQSNLASGYPNEASDQLNMIFNVVGTPQPFDLTHISDKRVITYLNSFVQKPQKDFRA